MDMQELYDIYGTWHIPFWQTRWFIITLSVFGLLVVIGIGWFVVQRIWSKNKHISPWQEALAGLASLQKEHISSQEDAQIAYCALTDILKRYFAQRYERSAQAMTDEEFRLFLERIVLPSELLVRLEALLQAGVVAKFAGEQVLNAQFHQDVITAIALVKATIPTEKKA